MKQHLKNWLASHINKFKKIRPAHISTRHQVLYAKRISFLLSSHASLSDALNIISKQNKLHAHTIKILIEGIVSGKKLSEIPEHQNIFGVSSTALIVLGEESGTLDVAFDKISLQLEMMYTLKQKIIGSLMYPVIVMFGTLILLIGLIIFIFPRLSSVFSGLRIELPLLTRLVISGSVWLKEWWWVVIVFILGLFSLFYYLWFYKFKFKILLQKYFLHIPVIKSFISIYYQTRLFSVIGLLLEQGSSLSHALSVISLHISYWWYKSILIESVKVVGSGRQLSPFWLSKPELFNNDVVTVLAIGEHSGALAQSFIYGAKYMQDRLNRLLNSVTQSVEPVLMIIIGLIVAFIAVSIITPMYQITEHLNVR